MIPEIEYFNARLRGMQGALLPESQHEELLRASTKDTWITALRHTPYGKHLGPSVDIQDSTILYRAVDASIASRIHRLTHIVAGRPAVALKVCLAEQDLQNLLAVTSGIYNHENPMEIFAGTLAGGVLGTDQLEAMSRCGTTKEVADMLSSWAYSYHTVYRRSLGRHAEKPLIELRLDLSREFMGILLADARRSGYPVILRFLEERVDRINLITALMWRALPSDRDLMEFHIPGAPFTTRKTFGRMLAADDLSEVLSKLPAGPFRMSAIKAAQVIGSQETVSLFETALEWEIIHRYSRPLALDPLGAELLLAYLLSLRREGIRLKHSLTRLLYNIPVDVFFEMSGYV
jgi:vacuolar-type H+-ATPase subunit C/Vma6